MPRQCCQHVRLHPPLARLNRGTFSFTVCPLEWFMLVSFSVSSLVSSPLSSQEKHRCQSHLLKDGALKAEGKSLRLLEPHCRLHLTSADLSFHSHVFTPLLRASFLLILPIFHHHKPRCSSYFNQPSLVTHKPSEKIWALLTQGSRQNPFPCQS